MGWGGELSTNCCWVATDVPRVEQPAKAGHRGKNNDSLMDADDEILSKYSLVFSFN
jgi:hypothetical protein